MLLCLKCIINREFRLKECSIDKVKLCAFVNGSEIGCTSLTLTVAGPSDWDEAVHLPGLAFALGRNWLHFEVDSTCTWDQGMELFQFVFVAGTSVESWKCCC